MAEDTTTEALRRQLAETQEQMKKLDKQFHEEVGKLNQLIQVSTLLNATLNLSELLGLVMSSAKDLFNAEACSIMLVEEETGDLVFEVSVGEKSEDVTKHRIPKGQGIAGQVAQTGEPIFVQSAKDHAAFYQTIDQAVGFQTRNMIAVPLRIKDRIIGVAEIINAKGRPQFEEKDKPLALALASLAAVAIDNAQLYQKLSEALVTSRMSYRL
jgi:sigma-B regulation protein RsbU (phosphoserine phosphatase)